MQELSEETKQDLKAICDHFEDEDRSVRERQIRVWRKLKLMWENYSRLYYSDIAHDWRIWDATQESSNGDNYQDYYDKPINVFRSYLESLIAALSVTVPPVRCYPDDADNDQDRITAKAGDKIASLIYRHNDAPLLWLHGLFIMVTEGMIACYSYPKADHSYGTYKKEKYEEYEEMHEYSTCPNCGFELGDDIVAEEETEKVKDQYGPDESDVDLQNLVINKEQEICPNCAQLVDPKLNREPLIATRLVGITEEPKTRVCLEAYGGLYVKVPVYAKCQDDCPYLELSYETNVVNFIECYPELHDDFERGRETIAAGVYDTYEQYARLSPQYQNELPRDIVTVRNFWLRPCAFNYLNKEKADRLKKEFPNGVRVVFGNDTLAEAENESLDDCWTLTYNPLSDHIHFDPDGMLLTSVQEITNDLISLTLQTIEHGIGQTFADTSVLNFDQYGQRESSPGTITAAKAKTGQRLGDGFHEIKTSTLSGEVLPFGENIQRLGQMASGALPSLFGGQMTESRTASEYSMSRNQASQRLQIKWKMLTAWWKNIFGKVIPIYIKEVQADEREVRKDESGNFVNVFIRKAELEGKIGRIELEANENIPLTWNQRKDIVMQLMQLGNPDILSYIGDPDNLPIIREAIGLEDFRVPGEDEREAEREEIKNLINSEPIIMPPSVDPMMLQQMQMSGQMIPPEMMQAAQPQELPSVEIDREIDNHMLRFEVDRKWLISEAGRLAKIENPNGYKNVLLHALQHKNEFMMQQMQQQAQMAQQGAVPNEKPKESTTAPIKEEKDVRTS